MFINRKGYYDICLIIDLVKHSNSRELAASYNAVIQLQGIHCMILSV